MKKIVVKIRTTLKFIVLLCSITFLIIGAFALLYKPIYAVSFGGEHIGYSQNKGELQKRINDYMEKGNEDSKNLAFVSIDEIPTYKVCLLKRGITTNDDEIFEKVTATGVNYYKYYAILEDDEEKAYVSNFNVAEKVVSSLKKKDSENIDDISITEKYETKLEKFTSVDKVVSTLYKKKKPKLPTNVAIGKVTTSLNISRSKPSLGISLIRPTTGRITSRFASSSRLRVSYHTGLDIGAPAGTPIKAAYRGVVSFAATKGAFGKLIVVTHVNGIQTYYGHCSKLYAKPGQTVEQGEVIAAVGSTGNSTGPHLHFEVRVNGVAYNPQNYVY